MSDIQFRTHAKEGSGHWYTREGMQVETVTGSKGQPVKPDIRHARKHQFAPGVTTICGVANRPDLEIWKVRTAISTAIKTERRPGETDMDLARRIESACDDAVGELADEGTRIHMALQSAFQRQPYVPEYAPHVEAALTALEHALGKQDWQAEKCVVSPHGYGTKVDLISKDWIIDTKSKDGDLAALQALKPYESYRMQLAAGDWAAPDAANEHRRRAILYVSRDHKGVAFLREVEPPYENDIAKFLCLLKFWQLRQGYRPDWALPIQ